jgi:tRNA-splicing endonuclease subunit Sen2
MARGKSSGNAKSSGRRAEIQKEYAHPLPIAFPNLPLYPRLALSTLGLSNFIIDHPCCIGTIDTDTQSVWVSDAKDIAVLWKRGFFGKGNLSRSEPTWFARQQGSSQFLLLLYFPTSCWLMQNTDRAAELLTAQRRTARQQFKQDRARAILEANEQAEAAFAAGEEADAATFLSAPKRPSERITIVSSKGEDGDDEEEVPPVEEDIEHLQLTFQEAFFLSWSLNCLSLFEPDNVRERSSLF